MKSTIYSNLTTLTLLSLLTPLLGAASTRKIIYTSSSHLSKYTATLSAPLKGNSPLLQRNPFSHYAANQGPRALQLACQQGDYATVKTCLNTMTPADINQSDPYGRTPFYIACQQGHKEIVALLLKDQRIAINQASHQGYTPLYIACLNGENEVVALLLQDQRIALNQVDHFGYSPLFIVCQKGHSSLLKLLLTKDSLAVNPTDKFGYTPLAIACEWGHTNIVASLLQDSRTAVDQPLSGKDRLANLCLTLANLKGATPLYIACLYRHSSVVELLLRDGRANSNHPIPQWFRRTTTPYQLALKLQDNSLLQYFHAVKEE